MDRAVGIKAEQLPDGSYRVTNNGVYITDCNKNELPEMLEALAEAERNKNEH